MKQQAIKGLVVCVVVASIAACGKPSEGEAGISEKKTATGASSATGGQTAAATPAVNPGTLLKSGLWAISVTGQGPMGMNAKVCIGKDYGKAFSGGFASHSKGCDSVTARQEGGSIIVDARCKAGGGQMNILQTITPHGDTRFTQVTEMRFEPARPGMPEMKTTAEGVYEGPCPEGMSEGTLQR
jgi:hypothetical protein